MLKRIICLAAVLAMCLCTACSGGNYTEKDAESMIAKFYDGLKNSNYDEMMGQYPLFYLKAMKGELEEYGYKDTSVYMDDIEETYNKKFGSDYKITVEINDFEKLTTTERNERTTLIAETFGIAKPNITEAYSFNCKETTAGSVSSETYETEYFILVIDDKAYIYDLLYEEMKAENAG